MRVQTTSTMAENGDKHNNNAREFGKHKNNAIRVLSTGTMAEDGDKHKNNINEVPKHKNYDK